MSNFQLEKVNVGQLDTNCYFLLDKDTNQMAIIDPGAESERLAQKIDKCGWQPSVIINTHGHWDHIGANKYLQGKYDLPIFIHEDDADALNDAGLNLADWMGENGDGGKLSRLLKDGDMVGVGNLKLQVIHTPGHSPGGICLYLAEDNLLLCGDTLFELSAGRSDLPGGDWETLMQSIKEKIYVLPDETVVYPGHGEATSIGVEKRQNPFVRG